MTMDVDAEIFTLYVKPSDASPASMHVLRMIKCTYSLCSTVRCSCSNANLLAQYFVNVMLQKHAKITTL